MHDHMKCVIHMNGEGLNQGYVLLTSNQKVLGSNPSWILSFFRIFNNDLTLMLVSIIWSI